MSRAEIGASRAGLSRGWHENEVKKRRQVNRDERRKNRWGQEGREREESRMDGAKARRERKEKGGTVKRDNLCSSCNSPVMPLYHQTRPVFATLPAYIFVFIRSPARCLGLRKRGNVPELRYAVMGDASRS